MNRKLRQILLFALEGPRKPWWFTPCIMVVSGVGLMLAVMVYFDRNRALGPLIFFGATWLITFWWLISRGLEWRYWRSVAGLKDLSTCPICGYLLRGSGGRVCPECGADPVAHVLHAKRITRGRDESRGVDDDQ
jgi:hypothetical protein